MNRNLNQNMNQTQDRETISNVSHDNEHNVNNRSRVRNDDNTPSSTPGTSDQSEVNHNNHVNPNKLENSINDTVNSSIESRKHQNNASSHSLLPITQPPSASNTPRDPVNHKVHVNRNNNSNPTDEEDMYLNSALERELRSPHPSTQGSQPRDTSNIPIPVRIPKEYDNITDKELEENLRFGQPPIQSQENNVQQQLRGNANLSIDGDDADEDD